MPEFKIKMPDGQIRTVSGPDREGAMAFAKANYRPTTVAAPAPAEDNPDGTGFDRAVRRGAFQTTSALPTALATADVRALSDRDKLQSPSGPAGIKYDELMRAGVPQGAMASRGVNLEDNQATSALMSQYGVSPQAQVNYGQVVDKRIENANNVDSQAAAERIQSNVGSASYWQDKAAALPMSPGAEKYAEALSEAPDSFKGWLSTVTNDPVGFMTFLGETVAESAPQMAAGIATTAATGNPLAGATVMSLGGLGREYSNEVNNFLKENGVDLSDPSQAATLFKNPELMDKANERGLTRGLVIAAADFAGQGLVATQIIKKSLTRQTVAQAASEGAGESLATAAVGDEQSFKENITEALAGGASAAPQALVAGNSLWQKRYNAENQEYQAAASDLARLLRSISDKEGLNLKDVTTQGAAKQTLEAAHEQISGQIKAIVGAPGVRERLSPKNAETLDQLLEDYAAATTAVRQGKNKVKSKVTDENGQAMARLLGPTKEAGQLLNLFAQGNVLTDLFADGTKGGVSQFTDFLNPLQNDGGGGFNVYRGLNVLGGVAGATQFGIPATAGIIAGGRAIDAVTGRRSKVNRFVKKLEKLTGQEAPQGPSLIAAAALERQQAEQAKIDDAAQKAAQAEQKAATEAETANITATLAGITGNATDGSPLGTIAVGTGIDPQEIQTVISELRLKHPADSKKPEDVDINKVLDDAQAGLNGEQKPIRALTQLVNLVNNHLNADLLDGGSSVQRTSLPDQPLAQAKAIQRGNVPTMDAAPTQPQAPTAPSVMTQAPAQPTVNGNQTTTPENYQAGKQANQDFALNLQEQVLDTLDLAARQASNRPEGGPTVEMLDTEAEALYIALESVQTENMPIEVMEEVQQALLEEGVSQENVNKFYKPYVDRARRQQARKPSMLAQSQATQAAIQGEPAVNTETAPAPSVLEQAQKLQQPNTDTSQAPTPSSPDQPISDDSRGIPAGPFTPAYNKAEMVNTSTINNTIPKGNKPRYDVGKIDTVVDYNAEDWMYDDFAKTGKPTLKESISKEGIKEPIEIMVSKKTGDMVLGEGNHRLKAATELGMDEVPVVVYVKDDLGFIDGEVPAKIDTKGLKAGEYYSLSEIDLDSRMIEGKKPAGQGSFQYIRKDGTFSPEPDPTRYTPMRAEAAMSDASRSVPEMPPPPRQFGEKTDVSLETSLSNAFQAAQTKMYAKGRDFKLDLQAQSLAAQEREGIDLNTLDDANIDRLADFAVVDALEALKDNENAIGWYGRTVTEALNSVAELHPEVLTDPKAKMQFIWATAVTSNGLKVDKNFELALDVYETIKTTGRFPTDAGIGKAAKAINQGLQKYHTMLEKFQRMSNTDGGAHALLDEFMNGKFPLKELQKEYGVKISGESANTEIRGSAILGPKIGGGFYSNLYGNFDELTMDRWLMRTVGRWRGGLVKINKPMIATKTKEIQSLLETADLKALKPLFKKSGVFPRKKMSKDMVHTLSLVIAKESMDPAWREQINAIPGGEELRKKGNGLYGYIDGQVEMPAGPKERVFIRSVFAQALERLQTAPEIRKISNEPLNMSDLQALLWYPEKRLYDTAKQKDGESRGYKDDEAPDYANAAKAAVGNRLRSTGAAGYGGGGPSASNAGPTSDNSIQPALLSPPGPAGGRAPRSDAVTGPTTKGRTLARVALTAVKRFVPEAKVPFQVGKRGTKYEDGIQTLDQALYLAQTLGITVRLFDSQEEAFASRYAIDKNADRDAEASFYLKGPYEGGKGAEGTIFGLNPGALLDNGGRVSGIEALSNVIHEIAHGMTLGPLDLNGSQVNDTEFTNPVTGEINSAPPGSFAGSALRPLLEGKGDPDIMSEIDNLQLNVDAYTTNDPAQRSALRGVRQLMDSLDDWKDYYQKEVDAGLMSEADATAGMGRRQANMDYYTDYMQGIRELAVDPVLIYLINPKLAKAVMPKTAALIREQFNNAGNNKVKFYSHPMAVVIATVMAMLAQGMAEEEEEEQQMQIPPGALSPPPPGMGALTA